MASFGCAFCSCRALQLPLQPSALRVSLLAQASAIREHPSLSRRYRALVGLGGCFACLWARGPRTWRTCRPSLEASEAQSTEAQGTSSASAQPEPVPGKSSETPGTAKAPRNRWLNLLERLVRDLAEVSARPRRDATYWGLVLGSLLLAVVSDFLGIMRFLLSLNPDGAKELGLDEVYPVEGLKTYRQQGRYRLRYPGEWLFDQSVAFSKQAAIEVPTLRQKKRIVPDAGFGPAGGGLATPATAQNLSVVIQPVKSQRLEDLMGEPEEAFRKLAAETLAAEGSGKTAELVSAGRTARGSYELEYLVTFPDKGSAVTIHCWSVVALAPKRPTSALYTMLLNFF